MKEAPLRGTGPLPVFDVVELGSAAGSASAGFDPAGAGDGRGPGSGMPGHDRGRRGGPSRGAALMAALLGLLVLAIMVGSASLNSDALPSPSSGPSVTAAPAELTASPSLTPGDGPTLLLGPTPPLGPTSLLGPTPLLGPAVPCGTLVPTPDLGVFIIAGSGPSVAGSAGKATPPEVHARFDQEVRIFVDGEACAVGWKIGLIDTQTGIDTTVDSSPADPSAYAVQNRWSVRTQGRHVLWATLRFANGVEIIRNWIVTVDPFTPPTLYLIGPDGTRFAATPGCGLAVILSSGSQPAEPCRSIGYALTASSLRVPSFTVIGIAIPGWQIARWAATCGRLSADGSTFETPGGCDLGGATSDSSSPTAVPDPPAFVLPPGDTVVRINVVAIGATGTRISLPYYAHVVAR